MATTYTVPWTKGTFDHSRFLLRDTAAPFLLQDEELQSLIDGYGWLEGTAQAAESLALYWARQGDELSQGTGGGEGIRVRWHDRAKFYQDLANKIRENGIDPDVTYLTSASAGLIEFPDTSPLI